MEKKIEPMEPILETISLGNNENSCLIKIGSTLNEKERKNLQELLMKFQEVFAWSYEDMPDVKLWFTTMFYVGFIPWQKVL